MTVFWKYWYQVSHENIVRLHEDHHFPDYLYLVMELVTVRTQLYLVMELVTVRTHLNLVM